MSGNCNKKIPLSAENVLVFFFFAQKILLHIVSENNRQERKKEKRKTSNFPHQRSQTATLEKVNSLMLFETFRNVHLKAVLNL